MSASENAAAARTQATTGSSVLRMLAVLAPTSGRAKRKAVIGTTVQTTASVAMTSVPVGSSAWSDPVATPKPVVLVAAPVVTSAARTSGSTRRVTPSATST